MSIHTTRLGSTVQKRPELTAFIVLLLACLVFVIFVGITERPAVFSERTEEKTIVIMDTRYEREADESTPLGYYYRVRIKLDKPFYGEAYLAYRMIHEYTEARLDGALIYSVYPKTTNVFGKTSGNYWAMVPLYSSDLSKEVEIRIIPVYQGVDSLPREFLLGEKSEILGSEARKAIPSFALSLIALLVGILYILISRLNQISNQDMAISLRCLGFFSILLGCWRLSDMRVSSLLIPGGSIFFSYVTLFSLMLIPVPLAFYLWKKLKLSRRTLSILCAGFTAIDAAILIMQLTNVRDVRQNLPLIHGSDVAAIIIVLILVTWAGRHRKERINASFNVWVVLLVFAGILADLFEYYFINADENMIWTVLVVDCYVIGTGINVLSRMRKEASIDMATGIYNKNRCQEYLGRPGAVPAYTMVIMFDLNGLKHTNDTLGHEAGDLMIHEFAEALKTTFARSSDFVGRFGGDEFVVVLSNVMNEAEARAQLARFHQQIETRQQAHPEVPLRYAQGFCLSEAGTDEDLEYLLRKADMAMYLDKKAWYDRNPQMQRRTV